MPPGKGLKVLGKYDNCRPDVAVTPPPQDAIFALLMHLSNLVEITVMPSPMRRFANLVSGIG